MCSINANSCKLFVLLTFFLIFMSYTFISAENSFTNQTSILECEKDDLLILTNGMTGEHVMKNPFVAVENSRSGLHGVVPTNFVYILPTLTKPSFDLVVKFFFNIGLILATK